MGGGKIFIIGFNKTGTVSLSTFFERNGVRTLHWEGGVLARNMQANISAGRAPISKRYDRIRVFADMEYVDHTCEKSPIYIAVDNFKLLDAAYPDAKFILNIRDVDNWIKSRNRHGRGRYLRTIAAIHKLSWHHVNVKWRRDHLRHHAAVVGHFKGRPNKLLVFDIERDGPGKLVDFFGDDGLDARHWRRENQTTTLPRRQYTDELRI
jgi:hypothetical protein